MFWFDFLIALFIALFISTVFVAILGWRHPVETEDAGAAGGTALFLFLILFLATWAGGIWLYPFGPVLFGGYLFPFLMVGLVVALVLAAAAPMSEERRRWGRTAMAGMTPPMTPPPEGPANPASTTATSVAPEGTNMAAAERREARARNAFGVFFWTLLGVLSLAILVTYLF